MDWYYVDGETRVGPLDEAGLQREVSEGAISLDTLVWNETLPDWQRYGELTGQSAAPPTTGICAECGKAHPVDTLLAYEGVWVCDACKPAHFQRLVQGTPRPLAARYGGFWRRFGAKFIDYTLLGVFAIPVQTVLMAATRTNPLLFVVLSMFLSLIHYGVTVVYETYFVGARGATPGKMVMGLRIVVSDGSRVSYARACGRSFAQILSALIVYVGYIMAAFDPEKRTLHDYICNTRVIRTS